MSQPNQRADHDRLARAIRGEQPVRSPTLELRQGQISAVDSANQRVSITLGGGSTVIPSVSHLASYLPLVGDTCWVLVNGPDLFVLDRRSAPGQPVAGPFGHAGRTGGFQSFGQVTLSAAQQSGGGIVYTSSSGTGLRVPYTGLYDVRIRGYFTGPNPGRCTTQFTINGAGNNRVAGNMWKGDNSDMRFDNSAIVSLNANDVVGMLTAGPTDDSHWGTDGYNGCWVEVRFVSF